MALPQQEQEQASAARSGTPDHRPGPVRAALAGGLLVAVFALVLGAFDASRLLAGPPAARITPTATTAVPPGWRLYRDPDGAFTLAIPPDWQVDRSSSTASGRFGGTTAQVPTSYAQFGPPYQSTPPTALSIAVRGMVDLAQAQALCQNWRPDTTLAGLRAATLPGQADEWLLVTTAASYQITYMLPGDPGNSMRTTVPTPLPQATVAAAQAQLDEVLSTFRPIPATQPAC